MKKHGFVTTLALLAMLCVAAPASAHNGNVKYIDIASKSDSVSVVVRVDATDAAAATGLGTEMDAASLAARADVMRAWMLRGLRVESDGQRCTFTANEPRIAAEQVALDIDYACNMGGHIVFIDDSLAADDDTHQSFVTLTDQDRGSVLRGSDNSIVISEEVATTAVAAGFLWEGVIHLVTGYDHVLFLLTLLFGAGVLARRRGVKIAGKDIALVVTAFTVGHSITLIAASLELVVLPARIVESVIAASIIAVAALNIAKPESTSGRPSIALVFGLIHGFGFSSVLADVGLPAAERATALLSFNVGIELAQLAVVAVAIAPLAWLAKQERFYRAFVMRGGSLAIAAIACFWLAERALGL